MKPEDAAAKFMEPYGDVCDGIKRSELEDIIASEFQSLTVSEPSIVKAMLERLRQHPHAFVEDVLNEIENIASFTSVPTDANEATCMMADCTEPPAHFCVEHVLEVHCPDPGDDPDAPCVAGEPMMHGDKPYRWCATHDDLMLRCDIRRENEKENTDAK